MSQKKLSDSLKQKLIQNSIKKKLERINHDNQDDALVALPRKSIPDKYYRFDKLPGYLHVQTIRKGSEKLGVSNPFFRVHDGVAGATTKINGK